MTQKRNSSKAKSVSSVGLQGNMSAPSSQGKQTAVGKATSPKSVALAEAEIPENRLLGASEKKGLSLPSWHFLGVLLILLSGGIGFAATSILLSFNGSSNCSALYLPLTSATTRLYCAQIETEKETLASYLKAIRMVNGFPADHPMRADIDRNIEVWIVDIIALAEVEFQDGNLDGAIQMVQAIPTDLGATPLVTEQIAQWETLWREGEEIYAKFQRELKDGDIPQAMRTAIQLSYLETRYWSTVKYEEARNQIQLARKESGELDVAYVSLRRGGIENWLKAIDQASKISRDSYAYPQAQKLIDDARQNIIRYIQDVIDGRRWDELLSLSDRLPAQSNLDNMVVDWKILAQAGITARKGSVINLETALLQIQSIQPSSAVYDQSQILMRRWQQEITDVSLLEQADSLAVGGSISELEQAIAKLQLVPEGNPRYGESRKKISQWRNKIETIEDRPTLEYAKDLAATNRSDSLNEAILQARSIQPGRALYGEAQENIRKWQATIERRQDQPIFDRAVALGQRKQYSEAIAAANQISAGRALYPEMQAKVGAWKQQLSATAKLNEAYQAAARNSVQGLAQAIQLTRQIPSAAADARAEGRTAADRWSYGILNAAQQQANSSVTQAIATAKLIPSGTAAYSAAQTQIQAWQRSLTPIAPPATPAPIELNTTFPDPQA
ncbi:MAG: hypothetical protein HC799_17045 [Limnothrix sp. RL_2_0]|nr:hypothetical protein [Limnothrix sp. RL_2_0]